MVRQASNFTRVRAQLPAIESMRAEGKTWREIACRLASDPGITIDPAILRTYYSQISAAGRRPIENAVGQDPGLLDSIARQILQVATSGDPPDPTTSSGRFVAAIQLLVAKTAAICMTALAAPSGTTAEPVRKPNGSPIVAGGKTNPAPTPPTAQKRVFTEALEVLTAAGLESGVARRLLGKWRKAYGDETVLNAVDRFRNSGASDPAPWITAFFKSATKTLNKTSGIPSTAESQALGGTAGSPRSHAARGVPAYVDPRLTGKSWIFLGWEHPLNGRGRPEPLWRHQIWRDPAGHAVTLAPENLTPDQIPSIDLDAGIIIDRTAPSMREA